MARQPEVFVRELDPAEAQRLVKITRTARDRVRLRRGGIVLASMQGRSPAEAAGMFAATAQYAREVIHAFNTQGFAALDPNGAAADPVSSDRPPARSSVGSGEPVRTTGGDRLLPTRRGGRRVGHRGVPPGAPKAPGVRVRRAVGNTTRSPSGMAPLSRART